MSKTSGSRFIVQMAIRAGDQIDIWGGNFWFMVMDQVNQEQRALYFFGNIDAPPKRPIVWSMTTPAITTTPKPLSVADWSGKAILWERQWGAKFVDEMIVSPDALDGHVIRFGINAHINDPQPGYGASHSYAAFGLREVSPAVELPEGTAKLSGPSVLAFAGRPAAVARTYA